MSRNLIKKYKFLQVLCHIIVIKKPAIYLATSSYATINHGIQK